MYKKEFAKKAKIIVESIYSEFEKKINDGLFFFESFKPGEGAIKVFSPGMNGSMSLANYVTNNKEKAEEIINWIEQNTKKYGALYYDGYREIDYRNGEGPIGSEAAVFSSHAAHVDAEHNALMALAYAFLGKKKQAKRILNSLEKRVGKSKGLFKGGIYYSIDKKDKPYPVNWMDKPKEDIIATHLIALAYHVSGENYKVYKLLDKDFLERETVSNYDGAYTPIIRALTHNYLFKDPLKAKRIVQNIDEKIGYKSKYKTKGNKIIYDEQNIKVNAMMAFLLGSLGS